MSLKADDEEIEERLITDVHQYGMHVLLDDDSSWDIQPGPSTKVILWSPTQRVAVEEGDEGEFILTNLDTRDRVPATPGFWDPDDEEDGKEEDE